MNKWKPPATTRDFRFWISFHAVERFRERVAQAIEVEKMAKERRTAAQRELDDAQAILDGATSQVEKLLAQMQAQRS